MAQYDATSAYFATGITQFYLDVMEIGRAHV